jgi:hypothetical protein
LRPVDELQLKQQTQKNTSNCSNGPIPVLSALLQLSLARKSRFRILGR